MIKRDALIAIVVSAAVTALGCGSSEADRVARDGTCDGRVDGPATITAWFHAAEGPERDVVRDQVARFNASQEEVVVNLSVFPDSDFTSEVEAAAAQGTLPDVLDFDGPGLYSFAWSGKLRPLDSCISPDLRDDLLPSIRRQGTYGGQLWGVGTFDSGLGLYVRPSVLREAGIRVPSGVESAWSADEFTRILKTLRGRGFETPLDLKYSRAAVGKGPEWYAYAYAPVLWSAGADLIDRQGYRSADGVLNSDDAVRALRVVQRWANDGLLAQDTDSSHDAFLSGDAPIAWVGHWVYREFTEAHGDDLAIVPLPDFGNGVRSGMGSWQWGITSSAPDGDAAWRFISFLMQRGEITRMTEANGAIPARSSTLQTQQEFAKGGPLHLYREQIERSVAVPRPQTPAYPAITKAFAEAVHAIMTGEPVRPALDQAVDTIDRDIDANGGYRRVSP